MKKLLLLLANSLEWLFTEYGFSIVYSEYYSSFSGGGLIRLENSNLRIDLISDRHKSYLEFSSKKYKKANVTTTFDIISQILTNDICNETYINNSQVTFLRKNFSKIIDLFEESNIDETIKKIKRLEKERAKRLFR